MKQKIEKQGMIVTTNRFSKAAREYAEKIDIQLWDGKRLEKSLMI